MEAAHAFKQRGVVVEFFIREPDGQVELIGKHVIQILLLCGEQAAAEGAKPVRKLTQPLPLRIHLLLAEAQAQIVGLRVHVLRGAQIGARGQIAALQRIGHLIGYKRVKVRLLPGCFQLCAARQR